MLKLSLRLGDRATMISEFTYRWRVLKSYSEDRLVPVAVIDANNAYATWWCTFLRGFDA